MKAAHVKFKDPKYNYSTSVNGELSDEHIKASFIGSTFNLGGMSWNHETDQETEIDNLQTCVDCEVTKE